MRWALLQMDEETREFLRERSERIRSLHDNQGKELERFDVESINLGFSALAIAEPPRESYGDDDDSDSVTGSMLSLHRSGNYWLQGSFSKLNPSSFDKCLLTKFNRVSLHLYRSNKSIPNWSWFI